MNEKQKLIRETAQKFEALRPDVYGDQFTLDDVLAPVYGLEPSQILTEFAALEFYVMERVNKSVETITVNFTKEA